MTLAKDTRTPGITRLTAAVLRSLPPGPCLDQAVLAWKPHPAEISSPPSPAVLTHLSKRRNLYGATLEAATTPTPEGLSSHPDYEKARVERALALNPNLTIDAARQLLSKAHTKHDAALLLALLRRSPYVASILSEQPETLSLLSLRHGQPGPRVLGTRLNDLEPYEAPTLTDSFYPLGGLRTSTRQSPKAVLAAAVAAYIDLVTYDRIVPRIPTLAALAETLIPAAVGRQQQGTIARALTGEVAGLPGNAILHVTHVFRVNPEPPTTREKNDPTRASAVTLEGVLAYPDSESQLPLPHSVPNWAPHAVATAADWIAPQLTDFRQLDAFNSLSREWNDTLKRLVDVSLAI